MLRIFVQNYKELRKQVDIEEIFYHPSAAYLVARLEDYVNEHGVPDNWQVKIRIPDISPQAGEQAIFEYVGKIEGNHFFKFLTVVP